MTSPIPTEGGHTPGECAVCGSTFKPRRSSQAYCSRPCARAKNGGQNRKPETWWKTSLGYIAGRVWIDGVQVYRRQHRWVVEQAIGRPLRADEDVHHLNGDKTDNRIENLELMTHKEHAALTQRERTAWRKGHKLNLTPAQRQARSDRMRRQRAEWRHNGIEEKRAAAERQAKAALALATGGEDVR